MSPEQALKPSTVDVPSDVWSFGAMLYELTTGAPPFDGESAHAVVLAAASLPHTPMDVAAPEVPTPLARLVDRCLAKDPAARPTASEVLAALDGILGSDVHRGALGERPSMLDVDLRPSLATASTDEAPAYPRGSTEVRALAESASPPPPNAGVAASQRRRAIVVGALLGLALIGLAVVARRATVAPSVEPPRSGARPLLERAATAEPEVPVGPATSPRPAVTTLDRVRPADEAPSTATAAARAPAPAFATPRAEVPGGPATGVRPRASSIRPDEARPAPGTMDEPLAPSTAPAPTVAPEPTSAPPAREDVRPQTASSAAASTAATGTTAGTAPAVPTQSGSAPPPNSTPTPRRPSVPVRPATPATPPPFTF
jgi:serine/threonine-protein kinase